MHANEELIQRFYTALSQLDGAAMASCYASDVNDIQARFTFQNGKIKTHHDQFDLYKWMRQALGLKGVLLGWLPPVQDKLRATARAGLDAFKP